MKLYEFNFTNEGYELELTPATMSELTGIDRNRIAGMFGEGSVGKVEVIRDSETSWSDVGGDYHRSGCEYALFIMPGGQSGRYTCESLYDSANPKLAAFADAIERMYGDNHDERRAPEVLARYGALMGLAVDFVHLDGEFRSDWLPVISVSPAGAKSANPILLEMDSYWSGEIYGYSFELEGPLGDPHDESLWGLVGDDYVIEALGDELKHTIEWISRGIREAKLSA